MSAFSEAKHPRAAAGTTAGGQFAARQNSAPRGTLLEERGPLSRAEAAAATNAAVAATLWTSNEIGEWESEHGERPELGVDSRTYLASEIDDFVNAYPDLIAEARAAGYAATDGSGFAGALGHDFVLTRERHGAGFWDRDELRANGLGDRLTAAVTQRGEGDSLFVTEAGDAEFEFARHNTTRRDVASELLERTRTAFAANDRPLRASDAKALLANDFRHLSYTTQRELTESGSDRGA